MPEIWSVLGIEPTDDQALIRRAYADRLKQTRPEDDPEGFRRLRAAFEAARSGAPPPAPRPAPLPRAEPEPLALPPTPSPPGPPPLKPLRKPAPPIRMHLRAGRVPLAAQAWAEAVATSTISLTEQGDLQREIAAAAVQMPWLQLAELDTMIAEMQWEEAARAIGAPPAIVEIMEHRAALRWLAELRETAKAEYNPWQFAWRARILGARTLLLGPPGPVRRHFPYLFTKPNLAYWLTGLTRHQRYLEGFLNAERIAWCRASRTRIDAALAVWLWRLLLVTRLIS